MLIALFTGGHCLITGVPGLAKTLLIKTLAEILDLQLQADPVHARPDAVRHHGHGDSRGTARRRARCGSSHGPIFAQIILADEINRTPPKTQAALLEAMQEYHVTAAGRTYPLERPFFVLATQNPIELEGTYPLPEAQLDRFMFNVVMTYLPEDDEVRVVTETTGAEQPTVSRVLSGPDIMEFQQVVRQVVVNDEIARYAVRLSSASRPGTERDAGVRRQVREVGRRASRLAGDDSRRQGARADKRPPSRVGQGHPGAGAHRSCATAIITNFYAESEHLNADAVVARLLDTVPVPQERTCRMKAGERGRRATCGFSTPPSSRGWARSS